MKKLLWKITIGVTVMLIMNFAMIGIANAASTGANYYGITYTEATKTVENGTTFWNAKLWSKTKNPTTSMDDIGYSWWTVREKCNGVITNQVQLPGHVLHYTSLYYSAQTMTKRTCAGDRLGESLGNHDFYKYPYQHQYLYLSEAQFVP